MYLIVAPAQMIQKLRTLVRGNTARHQKCIHMYLLCTKEG